MTATNRLNLRTHRSICNMRTIPSQQIIDPMYGSNRNMISINSEIRRDWAFFNQSFGKCTNALIRLKSRDVLNHSNSPIGSKKGTYP